MNPILDWMETTWVSQLAVGYAWSWPILEALHFLGMILLIGPLLVIDLRLLGFQRLMPTASIHELLPLAIIGFWINAITGILFFFGDPYRYAVNISFQLKMLLLVLAGLNFLLFQFKASPLLSGPGASTEIPGMAKGVAWASLLFWFGVLAFGRLIPYLGTG